MSNPGDQDIQCSPEWARDQSCQGTGTCGRTDCDHGPFASRGEIWQLRQLVARLEVRLDSTEERHRVSEAKIEALEKEVADLRSKVQSVER